jgi:hypothetical protein
MILDIVVVLDLPRMAEVEHPDGSIKKTRVNDCKYWAVIGPTDGYGKKNDHVFHNSSMLHVIADHIKKAKDQGITINSVTVFTDNCKGQYKSQFNMFFTAAFFEKFLGVKLNHCYAPVYEFKGTHDGYGKVIKTSLLSAEMDDIRVPDPQTAFPYLDRKHSGIKTEWKAYEEAKDPLLYSWGPKTMTDSQVLYATDSKEDFECMKQQHPASKHIIFIDREIDPPTVGDKKAEGSSKWYQMEGSSDYPDQNKQNQYSLVVSKAMCFCQRCRSKDPNERKSCTYRSLREPRQLIVTDVTNEANYVNTKRLLKILKRKFSCKDSYIANKTLENWLRQVGLTFDANEAKRRGLPKRTMMLVQLFENVESDSVILNPEAITTDENEEVEDEEQQEVTLNSPSVIDIGARTQAMNTEETRTAPCFIDDNELFGMSSLDELTYRALQANLKARGLGAKGKREELIERLSTAVENIYREKVVRDEVNEENDTDNSICETYDEDSNNGNDSDGSSSAGFESPDEESENESEKGIDKAAVTPAKPTRGDIADEALPTPTTPSIRSPLKSPVAKRVGQFIRNCTPSGLRRRKDDRLLSPMEEEKKNQVSSTDDNLELQSPFELKDVNTRSRASTGRKGRARKKRRDDAGRRKLAF